MSQAEPGTQRMLRRRCWRLRDRLFVVLTAHVAWALAWATPWLIEQSQILKINSARAFLLMLIPVEQPQHARPGAGPANPGSEAGGITAEELGKLIKRQIPAVEATVFVWRRIMWGVAGFVGLAALLAAVTGWSRFFHLLTAVVILLSTATTLIAMQLLIHPDYGGMAPLPLRSHIYVGLGQSAYGWLLLIAFARRAGPVAIAEGT